MDASFWHQRWERGEIAFHEGQPNSLLVAYFNRLSLAEGARVFLPLCGKTRDIAWLLGHNYRVAGVELSALAIDELFRDLALDPDISAIDQLTHYRAKDIDIFVGDIFALSADRLGPVNAVYDRAALVALPDGTRREYAAHMSNLTCAAPQLVISFDYDQSLMEGSPFSVTEEEITQLYGSNYKLTPIEHKNVAGGLKGKVAAKETAWLLQKAI